MPVRYKKRIRLKGFDYKGCYRYFITLCTFNKRPIFVGQGFSPASSKPKGLSYEKEASLKVCPTIDGVGQGFSPAELVIWLIDILKERSESFGFKIWAYCFMPDHLHLLIEGIGSDSDMKRFISSYKQHTGFYYKKETKTPLWQSNFYEHVLRKGKDTLSVARYILENPLRKGIAEDYRQYKFSGSFEFDIMQM